MIKRRIRKKIKKARELVPEKVADKAAELNPLTEPQQPVLTDENVPRITNETIAEHREDVLKGARKFIYPLAHSKKKIVVISSSIVIAAFIGLMIYCFVGLYKYYQYNAFLYRVTQVIPFPIARFDGTYIDYENYLFNLRRYVHYYQTQQQDLFGGDKQINTYRKEVLQNVIDNAYIKKMASQKGIKVSGKEVDERIAIMRAQNRLGSNDKVFADVLRDYWGWSISDFKRSLKEQILTEKVVASLDKAANQKSQSAIYKLQSGADFSDLAKQVSEDSRTKDKGGDYGFSISKTNPNIPPQVIDALFKLKEGQISTILIASPVSNGQPATLEIVKVTKKDPDRVTAQHISFILQDVSTYLKNIKSQQPAHSYVHF